MSFLYEYVKGIAVFLIFSAFAEIIVPSGNYRAYVKSVIGFLLIIIILTPIFNIFKGNILNNLFDSVEYKFDKNIMEKESEFYDDKQKEIMRDEFSKNLEKQAEKVLENLCVVSEAKFILKRDDFDIERAEFIVEPKEDEKNFFRIEKMKTDEEKNNEFTENIKKVISNFYNLPFDNIHIIVRKI